MIRFLYVPLSILLLSQPLFAQESKGADAEKLNISCSDTLVGVVSAVGVVREKSSLGYSIATLGSEDITAAGSASVVDALSGKVAGVNVTSSSGTVGGSSKIIIRGESSFTSSSQPLFVVDGMPMSNQNYWYDDMGSYIDIGSRIGDISADDIDSITILKGGAASALYGARAKGGAIIITTKRGSRSGGLSVSLNSSVCFETPLVLPDFQNSYAPGSVLTGLYDDTQQNGWGPSIESLGLEAFPDNVADFYDTGVSLINNISVAGGGEKGDFRLSVSSYEQSGIIPESSYSRSNIAFNGGREFSDKLSARLSLSYVKSSTTGAISQGDSDNSIISALYSTPRTVDISLLKDNYVGSDGMQSTLDADGKVGNYYWDVYNNTYTSALDRVYGSAMLLYKLHDNLTVTNNFGVDLYQEDRSQVYAVGSLAASEGESYTTAITHGSFNNDFMVSYALELNDDFKVKAMSGLNIYQQRYDYLNKHTTNLALSNSYSYTTSENIVSESDMSLRRLVGLYGEAGLEYRDMLYLSVTGRSDWSSTMPESHKSYFYPSVSASFVFSELMDSHVLDFGKVRLSYANVGSDTDPYMYDYIYSMAGSIWMQYGLDGSFPHGGLLGYEVSSIYLDAGLEPQQQGAFEAGVELGFLGGRIGLDASYYHNRTVNNIMTLDVAGSTGYSAMQTNGGAILNRGVELVLDVAAIVHRDFSWDVSFNFAKNRQTVEALSEGVSSYTLVSGYDACTVKAEVGDSFGLYGTYWQRDDNGNLLISSDGTRVPSTDVKRLGDIDADYTLGITTAFRYKNLSLSMLIDIQHGGVIYSGTAQNLRTSGLAAETLCGDRALIIDEGVVYGDASGAANTVAVEPYLYWSKNYSSSITEANVFDASYVKLRELVVSYRLPSRWLSGYYISSASVGVEACNLWLIASSTSYIDPETNLFGAWSVASGIEYNSVPSTKSYGFNVILQF